MDSFDQTKQFRYNPNASVEGDSDFSGILDIYVHHARNIHNICIYDNQDVYAKFSLTYNPDETLSTSIINGGGKNPVFNENLVMKIAQIDAVLKCEIWMLSRAKNLMEDQLLGFALVPISCVLGKGKYTQDFSLSSTDLFHSPAGTVRLTLSMNTNLPVNFSTKSLSNPIPNSSLATDVVVLDLVEYSSVEFPDINVVLENQMMVSEYINLAESVRPGLLVPGSFLQLGASHHPVDDYEMCGNSSEEGRGESVSPNGSVQNSGFLCSTMTSLSDDRISVDSMEKKITLANDLSNSPEGYLSSPTSKKESEVGDGKDSNEDKEKNKEEDTIGSIKFGSSFAPPLGNMSHEAEQSAMQKQIVDMYMRSMQQFTESLAKMKLPMDLDKPIVEDRGDVIQNHNNVEPEKAKKDGSRVFYGSRAFF